MPSPVKISDRLLARAREEAKGAHRSVTAQIEHWATLGRAVEVMTGHREVLALKRAGEHLAMPRYVSPQEIHDVLTRITSDPDRESVKARIQIAPDGRRTRGRFEGGTFVPAGRERPPVRVAARRRR